MRRPCPVCHHSGADSPFLHGSTASTNAGQQSCSRARHGISPAAPHGAVQARRQYHSVKKGTGSMNTKSIVLTSTLMCVLVTGAHAQRADAQRSTQQQQAQVLSRATPGGLIIPITGRLATPASPITPTEPTTAPSAESLTTPTPTTTDSDADLIEQVTGSFSIRRFAQTTTGQVAAVGIMIVSVIDPSSGAARTVVTEAAIPVVPSGGDDSSSRTSRLATTTTPRPLMTLSADSRATTTASAQRCETLNLALAPVQLDLIGLLVRLDETNIDFIPRTTGQLRTVLCGATSVTDGGVGPAERMKLLNSVLDAVD